jgi:hypothetical protein
MKVTKYSLGLIAVLFGFTGTVFADGIATAYADLNWAAVQFSGPVLPIAPPNADGLRGPTQTTATGVNLTTNETTNINNDPPGWGTATSKVQFGPRDYQQSSSDGLLSSFSSVTGHYILEGGVVRLGLIQSVDGSISIDIPYSFSVTTTGGHPPTNVEIVLLVSFFSPTGMGIGGTGLDRRYQSNGIDISESGVLSATTSNLQIGTYYGFELAAGSQVIHTDEPSTSLLLAFSLVCLGGLSFWKRFAQNRHALIMN